MDHRHVCLAVEGGVIEGDLERIRNTAGIVLFVHGSGSSRHSPRNRFVARALQEAGLSTLLMDLLTPAEDERPSARFDIHTLTQRVLVVLDEAGLSNELPVGLFGASTGAAAAFAAAARRPERIRAIVSRGGRPDLALAALPGVRAPSLLIVGGLDDAVLTLNKDAFQHLRCRKDLVIIEGATHLFEEKGKLADVARLAVDWFTRYLPVTPAPYPLSPP